MFTNLLPLFTTTVLLIGSGLAPESRILEAADLDATAAAHTAAPELSTGPLEMPAITAKLYISYAGNGYYFVVVDGHATTPNAAVGVRVYGEDTWFDDFLFSILGYARTDPFGNFNVSRTVHRSVLNEDWEGQDEIYAKVEVSGAGSVRTNTITQSF